MYVVFTNAIHCYENIDKKDDKKNFGFPISSYELQNGMLTRGAIDCNFKG